MVNQSTSQTTKTQRTPGTRRSRRPRPRIEPSAQAPEETARAVPEPKQLVKVNSAIVRRRQKARATGDLPSSTAAGGGTQYRSASEFVRQQPLETSVKAVVEAGAKVGLKVTSALVRVIRFKMRHEGAQRGPERRGAVRRGRPPRAAQTADVHSAGVERQFRKLVAELGTARARALVAEVDRRLEALISG